LHVVGHIVVIILRLAAFGHIILMTRATALAEISIRRSRSFEALAEISIRRSRSFEALAEISIRRSRSFEALAEIRNFEILKF